MAERVSDCSCVALSSEARVEGRGEARKKEKKKRRKVVIDVLICVTCDISFLVLPFPSPSSSLRLSGQEEGGASLFGEEIKLSVEWDSVRVPSVPSACANARVCWDE